MIDNPTERTMTSILNEEHNCATCSVKSSLFQILSKEELYMINKNKTSVIYRKGEIIRKQGAVLTHVISIGDGMAKVYLEGQRSNNVLLDILTPTAFVGGPGMFVNQVHHFTVSALTDCCVCFIRMEAFRELLHSNPSFSDEYLKHLSQVTISAYNRLINLTQKQMPGRLADSLIYLAKEVFNSSAFKIPFSSRDLAEMSGMSRDNVVRNLKRFQQEGIIEKQKDMIEIRDYDALKAISRDKSTFI